MAEVTAEQPWKPSFNPWLIAVVVAGAAFMEVLDTSIANVALPHLAGNLGASNDESTWVLTSYLVSNAIVLPISGWLAGLFGRKRFFILCIFIFTLSSMLCGAAPSLGALIVFRVLQGVGGGGLQPIAQAILADTFPPQQRGLAFALYGITAIMAPTIGPTLGGWITDSYSWRWIFYINFPVGLLVMFLAYRMVEDPPYLKRAKGAVVRVDYLGIALLTLGVGALQILLDKGQEDDWFGSNFIVTLTAITVTCLVTLVFWELRYPQPIIDIRLYKRFSFATANLMMFMLGVMLFSSLVMMPQFLQTLLGYTALTSGLVLSASGVLLLIEMPVVGQLTTKVPGEIYRQCRVVRARRRDVLFHGADGLTDQLHVGNVATRGAGFRLGLPIRAHLAHRVHRHTAGKRQQRIGYGEFHAQYRKRRGNFHGHYTAGAPCARPSSDAGATYD